jgi:hypothetical protein
MLNSDTCNDCGDKNRHCKDCGANRLAKVWRNGECPECGIQPITLHKKQSTAPTWQYIVAWPMLFGITGILASVITIFAVDTFGAANGLWIGNISEFVIRVFAAIIIYDKVFKRLNIKKVFNWLCVLGTIFAVARVGDSLTYTRDLGLDSSIYSNSELIFWVIFLFIFQYYFKNHSNYCWPKPILEKKSDDAITKTEGDPWTD